MVTALQSPMAEITPMEIRDKTPMAPTPQATEPAIITAAETRAPIAHVPKRKKMLKLTMLKLQHAMNLTLHSLTSRNLRKKCREKRRGIRPKCPCLPPNRQESFPRNQSCSTQTRVPQTTIFSNIKIKDRTQLLVYPCTYKSNTHKILFDSGAQHTMVHKPFVAKYKIPIVRSNFKYAKMADKSKVLLEGETTPFKIDLQGIQTSIKGLVMSNLNYNIVARMEWFSRVNPSISWKTKQ